LFFKKLILFLFFLFLLFFYQYDPLFYKFYKEALERLFDKNDRIDIILLWIFCNLPFQWFINLLMALIAQILPILFCNNLVVPDFVPKLVLHPLMTLSHLFHLNLHFGNLQLLLTLVLKDLRSQFFDLTFFFLQG